MTVIHDFTPVHASNGAPLASEMDIVRVRDGRMEVHVEGERFSQVAVRVDDRTIEQAAADARRARGSPLSPDHAAVAISTIGTGKSRGLTFTPEAARLLDEHAGFLNSGVGPAPDKREAYLMDALIMALAEQDR